MSTETLTLTEFLLARIEEDEGRRFGADWTAARVVAECGSKRAIMQIHSGSTDGDECPGCGAWLDGRWRTGPGETCRVLAAMAAVYAEHADYRPEWAS